MWNRCSPEEYIKKNTWKFSGWKIGKLLQVEVAIVFVNGRPEGKEVITSSENLGVWLSLRVEMIIEKAKGTDRQ